MMQANVPRGTMVVFGSVAAADTSMDEPVKDREFLGNA
jgi:hypothetical protein